MGNNKKSKLLDHSLMCLSILLTTFVLVGAMSTAHANTTKPNPHAQYDSYLFSTVMPPMANNCLNIDDGVNSRNIPPVTVTLSGHITNYYENHANDGEDGRTGEGRYLLLDTFIEVDSGGGCTNWNAIHVFGSDEIEDQFTVKENRHVTVTGELGQFTSAMINMPYYINVKKMEVTQ